MVSLPTVAVELREGCDGRQVQVSLGYNKLGNVQFVDVFLVCDFFRRGRSQAHVEMKDCPLY